MTDRKRTEEKLSSSASREFGFCVSERGSYITHLIDSETDTCSYCGYAPPPRVQWKHVDGPMMIRAGGTIKWLTWKERFMHWIGAWSLEEISKRPSL